MNRSFIIAIVVILIVVAGVFFFRLTAVKPQEKSSVVAQTKVSPTITKTILVVYEGKLPCADCEGVDTVLTLYQDETYSLSSTYLGKDTKPFIEKGKWTYVRGDATDPNATVYQLYDQEGSESHEENYLLDGNTIVPLDQDLKPIESPLPLTLTKQHSE